MQGWGGSCRGGWSVGHAGLWWVLRWWGGVGHSGVKGENNNVTPT